MAQLVRCYFRETGVGAADDSFKVGTAFELALDVEFTDSEIAIGGAFRVMVGVKNFNTSAVFIPAPVAPAPANNTQAVIVAPRNQTFVYTIPANSGATGEFLDAKAALVIGATGQDTDISDATCVIIP
jgi:hypothetical protein